MTEPQRLSDFPDWGYLLAEYYAAYRHRSAGGSKLIRSHIKLVRKRLSRCISGGEAVLARDGGAMKSTPSHILNALRLE